MISCDHRYPGCTGAATVAYGVRHPVTDRYTAVYLVCEPCLLTMHETTDQKWRRIDWDTALRVHRTVAAANAAQPSDQ